MTARPPILWPVLLVAAVSGTVVALVAIYASYSHMHDLVLLAGEDEDLARIVPASIDGLVFFAAAVAWAQHKAGEKVDRMASAALWLAGTASLAANVVSKWPEVATSWVARLAVAAWPAIAVIVMGDLAVTLIGLVLRERRPAPARSTARPGRAGVAGTAQRADPSPATGSAEDKPAEPRERPARTGRALSDDELLDLARSVPELSRSTLQAAAKATTGRGVQTDRAAQAVKAVQAERTAAGNGNGAA